MKEKNRSEKALVALSGGVDSAVSAAILKKQGYKVSGVFFIFKKEDTNPNSPHRKDAKKIAKILEIPLKIVDVRSRFKKQVIGYFTREYEKGRTPNPCVVCNEKVKFEILLKEMKKNRADFAATGHYARLRREVPNSKRQIPNKFKVKNTNIVKLLKARDDGKDQSYFLYRLGQKQLSRILFPIGKYKKSEVRKLAKKFKLPVFDKAESQNVCFIADDDINRFLQQKLKLKKGKIIDANGKIIGEHQGLPLYTIGQRKGIGVGGSGPYFVFAKDAKKNILLVTDDAKDEKLYSRRARVSDANWTFEEPKLPAKILVKIRYRNPAVQAMMKKFKAEKAIGRIYEVVFDVPQKAVTAGQSAVFYGKLGEVIGGGIIQAKN